MPSLPTNLSIDPITAIDMGDLGSLGSYRKQNTLRRIEDSVLKQMKDKNATMQKAILQDPSSAASMFLTLGSGLQENRAMEEMRDLRRSVEVSEIGRVRRETAKKQFDKNVKEVESMVKEVFPNLKGRVDVRSVTEKFTDPQTGRPNRQAILEHLDEQNKSIPLSRKQKTERFKSIAALEKQLKEATAEGNFALAKSLQENITAIHGEVGGKQIEISFGFEETDPDIGWFKQKFDNIGWDQTYKKNIGFTVSIDGVPTTIGIDDVDLDGNVLSVGGNVVAKLTPDQVKQYNLKKKEAADAGEKLYQVGPKGVIEVKTDEKDNVGADSVAADTAPKEGYKTEDEANKAHKALGNPSNWIVRQNQTGQWVILPSLQKKPSDQSTVQPVVPVGPDLRQPGTGAKVDLGTSVIPKGIQSPPLPPSEDKSVLVPAEGGDDPYKYTPPGSDGSSLAAMADQSQAPKPGVDELSKDSVGETKFGGKVYLDKDGYGVSEKSITITADDKIWVIPRVFNGKIVSRDEAKRIISENGWKDPEGRKGSVQKFNNEKEANVAIAKRSEVLAQWDKDRRGDLPALEQSTSEVDLRRSDPGMLGIDEFGDRHPSATAAPKVSLGEMEADRDQNTLDYLAKLKKERPEAWAAIPDDVKAKFGFPPEEDRLGTNIPPELRFPKSNIRERQDEVAPTVPGVENPRETADRLQAIQRGDLTQEVADIMREQGVTQEQAENILRTQRMEAIRSGKTDDVDVDEGDWADKLDAFVFGSKPQGKPVESVDTGKVLAQKAREFMEYEGVTGVSGDDVADYIGKNYGRFKKFLSRSTGIDKADAARQKRMDSGIDDTYLTRLAELHGDERLPKSTPLLSKFQKGFTRAGRGGHAKDIRPQFMVALAGIESGYDEKAVGKELDPVTGQRVKGGKDEGIGLVQILPSTARGTFIGKNRFKGKTDAEVTEMLKNDTVLNIAVSTQFAQQLHDKFKKNKYTKQFNKRDFELLLGTAYNNAGENFDKAVNQIFERNPDAPKTFQSILNLAGKYRNGKPHLERQTRDTIKRLKKALKKKYPRIHPTKPGRTIEPSFWEKFKAPFA